MSRLPIEDVVPALRDALLAGRDAVLTAPPGAGKTTRVPLALLDAAWLEGKKILQHTGRTSRSHGRLSHAAGYEGRFHDSY